MARRKRLSEGKQNIIQSLISEYDIKTADDIQNALKDLLGGTIESMLESELDEHLGYEPYERSEEENARNGYKKKTLVSKHGKIEIEVPQDRDSSFSPKVVKKRQKDISAIEEKIITMYAKGLSTKQISEQIEDIYGFEVSESLVSSITDKILVEVEEWQQRPLEELYPVVYIDDIHFSVREDGKISKIAAYIILALNEFGLKEVLGIYVRENESSKYWLGILNELKSRGVKEIWVLCSDGLTGIKEAIAVAFPKTEHQTCIVHMVRNTLKYVSYKDRKAYVGDLKTIYNAPNEEIAHQNMERVTEKWNKVYPRSMDRWQKSWDIVSPIFKYSEAVRKVIYTTNTIESLNSEYRRLNKNRSVFPSRTALLKALYLSTREITKKWTMPARYWGRILGELQLMNESKRETYHTIKPISGGYLTTLKSK